MQQLSKTKYWNTWTAESPANYVFLPAGFQIAFGAFSTKEDTYTTFPFDRNIRLLEHDSQGRYVHLEMTHAGTVLELEYVKTDDWTVAGRLRCKAHGEWALRFWPVISFGFGRAPEGPAMAFNVPTMEKTSERTAMGQCRSYCMGIAMRDEPVRTCIARDKHRVGRDIVKNGYYAATDDEPDGAWYTSLFNLEQNPEICFAVSVSNEPAVSAAQAKEALGVFADETALEERKTAILGACLSIEDGAYPEAAEALRDIMAWNTLSDETTGRWFTWITRFWNKKFGGWYVWMDDPYYHAYMNAMSGDWQTGRMSIQATIDNNVPEGNFACLMSELTEWVDRSQPPIGSFMVWKYYLLTGDRALLDAVYPALRDANFWWHTHRDGNGNGVYEYGSSPVGKGHFAHTKLAAMDESSMDNCPIYDKAAYIPETHTLDMEDVALNSLLVVDGECLQAMAKIVGDEASIPRLHSLTETLREKADAALWDDERKIYANRLWSGEFVDLCPTSFYPLLAGMPDAERVRALVGHIFNEDEFWTYVPLPAIWKQSPAFADNVYWRGRVWPPLNYMTYNGLKRYGLDKEASRLAARCMEIFSSRWKEERASFENYNSLTGQGSDSVDTDFFLGWGGLFPLMWVADHVDVDPWNGFHFGSVNGEDITIRRLRMADGFYTLRVKDGVTALEKNGHAVFSSTAKGRFRRFAHDGHYMTVEIGAQDAPFTVDTHAESAIRARCNGEETALESGRVTLPAGRDIRLEVWF